MKGILVKPDMHKAIREGRKTQTRRLAGLKEINQEPDKWKYRSIANIPSGFFFLSDDGLERTIHPRYQVGEVVYIKEAWAVIKLHDSLKPSEIPAYGRLPRWYKLDDPSPRDTQCNPWPEGNMGKWRSPLFMPAWVARDFIKITDVRAERLQEITEEDAIKEGIPPFAPNGKVQSSTIPRKHYVSLWDSINPKYPYLSNSWNFRYEFIYPI